MGRALRGGSAVSARPRKVPIRSTQASHQTDRSPPMTSPAPRTVAAPDVTDKLLCDRPVWGPFIGGAFVDDAAAATLPALEASTGTRLADLVTADADTVDRAVQDARRAYEETWRDLSPKERGDLLRKVAAVIREHADELAELG